ncbi:entry exclusion lipoprotein TrbK [Pseudomonas aeruginosa]|nr:entry exclusion lipoprotein TrbK [Pseudomonas aeruginosa]
MKPTMLLAGLVVALLAGCDSKPATQAMPEVNDANCQIEKIKRSRTRRRAKLSPGCARAGRGPAAASPRPRSR